MDMKKILQAMDGISTKPVEGADSMAKFLRVVKEAELNQPAISTLEQDPNFIRYTELMAKYDMLSAEMQPDSSGLGIEKGWSPEFEKEVNSLKAQADQLAGPNAQAWEQARKITPQQTQQQLATQLSEGANPHKVALPVQMAMQHYQTAVKPAVRKDRLIDKYFVEAETEIMQRQEEKRALINQYAKTIAERVLMKESMAGVGLQPIDELSTELLGKYKKAAGADAKKADAEGDYARGDKRFKGINRATNKQFDNDLKKHNQQGVAEELDEDLQRLYNLRDQIEEAIKQRLDPKCWTGKHKEGTKIKGGVRVNNCVPNKK